METISAIAVIVVFLAAMFVNLQAWRKKPHTARRPLYLWFAVISLALVIIYTLVVTGLLSVSFLVDYSCIRVMLILFGFGAIFHAWVDL